MKDLNTHLSDQQMLMDVDGELSPKEEALIRAHLDACWKCRVRRKEIEHAITDFVRFYQKENDGQLPPVEGPRALLKARLAELSATQSARHSTWFALSHKNVWTLAAAVCALLAFGLILARSSGFQRPQTRRRAMITSIPDSTLTPGATVLISRGAVCSGESAKNKAVPVSLQKKVFEEYGIAGAEPRAYEVDYLVTPALGGADDIHNLWPQPYFATVWNAKVKDELEDRLRQMVCDGTLDLTEAQREIATNWIEAYKKYFRTDSPLEH